MGFLATAQVLETSATDLVGEYIGQTGPKTQKLLEKALGKVLFIDEAYRLAEGQFAKEAMDEIVDRLTKPQFAQKLIVILAGYDNDINRLMSINPGLTSRFPETVTFRSLHPQECLELFTTILRNKKHLDIPALEAALSSDVQRVLLRHFETLASLDNWANARDVGTLAKAIFGQLLRNADPESSALMRPDKSSIFDAFDDMIKERKNRGQEMREELPVRPKQPLQMDALQSRDATAAANWGTSTSQKTQQPKHPPPKGPPPKSAPPKSPLPKSLPPKSPPPKKSSPNKPSPKVKVDDPRDPGVSDEAWLNLQRAKEATAAREKEYQNILAREAEATAEIARQWAEADAKAERHHQEQQRREEEMRRCHTAADAAKVVRLAAEADEAKRRLEQERLRRELERRRHEEEAARLQEQKRRMEKERRRDAEAQRKLRAMGVCVAGFRWIKIGGGYQCGGGSHFCSDAQLGLA